MKFTKAKLLLVEGTDEEKAFTRMLSEWKIEDIQIHPLNGKSSFKDKLSAVVKDDGFMNVISIGIIRDADECAQSQFQSVQDALRDLSLPIPEKINQTKKDGRLLVRVFIMPNCNSDGAMESLFVEAIKDDRIYSDCISSFKDCVINRGAILGYKNEAYMFISTRKEPDVRLGISVDRGDWDLSHPCFNPLKSFLREL